MHPAARHPRRTIQLVLTLLAAAGCAGGDAGGAVEVRGARARLTGGTGAVYLEVHNPGAVADRLVRITSADADAAEAHETVDEDGVLRMRPHPDGFAVPARASLLLEPGGKHIMLVEPRAEVSEIRLTLYFERGGEHRLTVPVEDLAAHHPGDHAHPPAGPSPEEGDGR